MRSLPWIGLTLLALAAFPARAEVELGVDFGFNRTSYDELGGTPVDADLSRIEIPVPEFRVGLPLSEILSLEPRTSVQILSGGGETLSILSLDAAVHAHLSPDLSSTRGYFGGGPSLVRFSGNGESASQIGFFAEGGVKMPVGSSFLFRVGAGYKRQFENEDDFLPSTNIVFVKLGFSALAKTGSE